MGIIIGDTVFSVGGRPGVVLSKDNLTKELRIQKQGKAFETMRKRGFINGLVPKDREKFNNVMDEISKIEVPKEKVSKLREKINEMKEDPRLHVVVRYLEGEMIHYINTWQLQPREYTADEATIR